MRRPRRDVLGTVLLSVLAGHWRYAHITALRADAVNAPLLGMKKVVSEDAVRRALSKIDEADGIGWLREQLECQRSLASSFARARARGGHHRPRSRPQRHRAARPRPGRDPGLAGSSRDPRLGNLHNGLGSRLTLFPEP